MSTSQGVPAIPAQLRDNTDFAHFVSIWQRVLDWESADGLRPLSGPRTVIAVTDDGLRMMTPCDVSDPFMVDRQLQCTLLRRHMVAEPVRPGDARFTAGGQAASLDGGAVKMSKLDGQPAFSAGDAPAAAARPVGDTDGDQVVYVVNTPFVGMSEISDAIGRHPQENPFAPPELEPEPVPPQ